MSYQDSLDKFGKIGVLPEGWYWLLRSDQLKNKEAKPTELLDLKLVVYRGEDGRVKILDAHCPHMGAHLCDGFVEGNSIRCPFHYWKFSDEGKCIEIPAQSETKNIPPLKSYKCEEAYGLIWIWTGHSSDTETVPVIPELKNIATEFKLGSHFFKNCHPNVVMINAIDAQHFRSVHNLIVDLNMKPTALSSRCIQLSNTTPLPQKNFFLKWAAQFYKNSLTYEMTYWWGHVGSVMVGPDFLHFYIIFALRPCLDGSTEGQTILITKKRKFGSLINPILLFLTKLVGDYFAKGDTIIFSRINFNFRTPIRADGAIISFVEHYEKQQLSSFVTKEEIPKAENWNQEKTLTH